MEIKMHLLWSGNRRVLSAFHGPKPLCRWRIRKCIPSFTW